MTHYQVIVWLCITMFLENLFSTVLTCSFHEIFSSSITLKN